MGQLFSVQDSWYEQFFLIKDDPNRFHLDSIFQSELDKRQIKASVAIRCKVGEDETLSQPVDFYSKAISLDVVSYRKDFDSAHLINLQPYVYFPCEWLIDCWSIYLLAAAWFFSTLLFIGLIRNKFRRLKQLLNVDIKQYDKRNYEPSIKVQWIALSGNIFFDEVHGVLQQGDKEVSLSGDSLLYFRSFIQKENFMLTYQDILEYIYGIKRDILSKNDRSRISHGVGRLQKQIQPFSNIQVILVRGKGYQLVMASDRSERISDCL